MRTTKKHITEIKPGDVVVHDGVRRTVCAKDLTYSEFMGVCLFGDSYRLGTKLVEVVA